MDNQQKASVLLVTGLVLIGINFLALAPFVAGQVEAGVADAVADGYDGYDDNGSKDYTADYDDEWLVSTSERVYFAYSLITQKVLMRVKSMNLPRWGHSSTKLLRLERF